MKVFVIVFVAQHCAYPLEVYEPPSDALLMPSRVLPSRQLDRGRHLLLLGYRECFAHVIAVGLSLCILADLPSNLA